MSGDSPSRPERSTDGWFNIGNVVVRPAPENAPEAYRYSDLEHTPDRGLRLTASYLVYWVSYLLFVWPFQLVVEAFRWNFWKRWTVSYRLRVLGASMVHAVVNSIHKTGFVLSGDRRFLYLRASHLFTPAQLLPVIRGTAPISADSNVRRPPDPENWDDIRRAVYDRDNYRCVNCGVGGGSHGDATLQADHVLPVSRGGPYELYNLRTLCRECHQARHARVFR